MNESKSFLEINILSIFGLYVYFKTKHKERKKISLTFS